MVLSASCFFQITLRMFTRNTNYTNYTRNKRIYLFSFPICKYMIRRGDIRKVFHKSPHAIPINIDRIYLQGRFKGIGLSRKGIKRAREFSHVWVWNKHRWIRTSSVRIRDDQLDRRYGKKFFELDHYCFDCDPTIKRNKELTNLHQKMNE